MPLKLHPRMGFTAKQFVVRYSTVQKIIFLFISISIPRQFVHIRLSHQFHLESWVNWNNVLQTDQSRRKKRCLNTVPDEKQNLWPNMPCADCRSWWERLLSLTISQTQMTRYTRIYSTEVLHQWAFNEDKASMGHHVESFTKGATCW